MNRASLIEARQRASLAEQRLYDLAHAEPNDQASVVQAWEEFLSEINRAFNKLFHGEQKASPTYAITQRVRSDRKDDPLLSYVRAARNVLEHGLGQSGTTGHKARPLEAHEQAPIMQLRLRHADGSKSVMRPSKSDFVVLAESFATLVRITDGTTQHEPPHMHLDASIDDKSPHGVGLLALKYLMDRISELEKVLS